jgi:K+-sensing histidine kinase KdpD
MARVESKLGQDITPTPDADPLLSSAPLEVSAIAGYLASVAMTVIATVIAVGIDSGVTIPNVSLVFVVPVIIAAVFFGLGASLCSALLGALAYNFFLIEPRYTLAVDEAANIWAIGLLFLVGLIVSSIAYTSRRRAIEAALLKKQATVLQGYSRDVVAAGNTKAIVSITSHALAALFQVPVVVMVVTEGDVVSVSSVGGLEPRPLEVEAARSALEMGSVARAGTYPTLDSRFDFWPVAGAVGPCAAIGLAFDLDERPSSADVLVDIVGGVLALALDGQHFRAGRDAPPAR